MSRREKMLHSSNIEREGTKRGWTEKKYEIERERERSPEKLTLNHGTL